MSAVDPTPDASGPVYSLKQLSRSAVLYTLGEITIKALSFLLVPLYVSALSPEDFGVIGFVNAMIQVLTPIVGLGLVNTMPILYHAVDEGPRQRLISTTVNFTLIYAAAACVLLTVFGREIPFLSSAGIPFFPHLVIGIWSVFTAAFFYLPLGIFNMSERPVAYATYSVGVAAVGIVANIILILILHMEALGALLATLISGIVSMGIAGAIIRRDYLPVLDRKRLMDVLQLALPALPHLFSSTLWRFADRFFLVGLTSLATTGVYSLGLTVASVALVVLGGISTALNPFFYRRAYSGYERLRVEWSRLCSLFFLVTAMVGLLLAYPTRDLLLMLTPSNYHDVVTLLPPLVLGQCLTAAYWIFSPGIGFSKRTWAYPAASIPALATNLLLNLLLIPRLGATGAALAVVGASLLQLLIFASVSQRAFAIPYQWTSLIKLLVFVTAAAVFCSSVTASGNLGTLLVQCLAILAVLPMLLLVGFFERTEIEAVRRVLRSRNHPTRAND